MTDYKIEKIDVFDFEEIDLIEQDVFHHPYSKTIFLNDYRNNRFSRYFKLMVNNKMVGYFVLWIIYNDCQLISIGVKNDFQRQGYGKIIMDYIIDFVKAEACDNITLEVRVSNERAMALYNQYGFYKVALRKHYYENGEDAFLMKCDL